MKVKFVRNGFAYALVVVTAASSFPWAKAVPYASATRNTAGDTWEFVLNEAADNVTVLRNGGNALDLGALAAGRHTFDMTGFANFEIKVAKNAAPGWTAIHNPANAFLNFERPTDIAVNNNPASPYFGTIYVNNSRTNSTVAGRALGDGVYALTADMLGVDLSTRAALTDPNDTSAAKAPGWNVGPLGTDTGVSSAFRIAFDDASNLIVGDFSNANGGIKYASADLTSGGSLLLNQDGVRPLLTNGSGQEVHGSIASTPYVTGTLFNNLTVTAIDEDLNPAAPTVAATGPGNSLWKWNVGSATNYDQPPQLIVDASKVPRTNDATPRENWMNTNLGVNTEAIFSPVHNKWYISQNRSDGSQAGLIVVSPDGVDGSSPVLNWSSLQWTIDNGLDGNTAVANTTDGHGQDVFRQILNISLSPDGTKIYAARNAQTSTTNPVLGTTTTPGAILVIPLDATGIPVINLEAGVVTNIDSIVTASNTAGSATRPVTLDAAGNLYTASSSSERLQVFSPGGNWIASTTSAGAFTLTPVVAENADFDGDGDVDGADFLTWQQNFGTAGGLAQGDADGNGQIEAADLTIWKNQFGTIPPATAAVASVPEPASWIMAAAVAIAMTIAGIDRRRVAATRT